jgi:N-carbamoyl-L-amino-acid hydrolase
VGTIGMISAAPNASNVIAGQADLVAEWRSIDPALLERLAADVEQQVHEIAAQRGLRLTYSPLSDTEPVQVPESVQTLLRQTCEALGLRAQLLPSGAGHDTNHLAELAPAGMVFIPSRAGRSHCPEEWSEIEAIGQGAQVMGQALLTFDRGQEPS